LYHQRLYTCFGTSEALRRVVRLALGDPLFFLLAALPVLDFTLGTANGFSLCLANPGTAKHCTDVQTADIPFNNRHVKSIVQGCLSGLIFFDHASGYIYEV
jgi:hypothetical protein